MPSPLSSNASTPTPSSSTGTASRSSSNGAGKDFGQMLQGSPTASATPAPSATSKAPTPSGTGAPQDGNADKGARHPADADTGSTDAGAATSTPPTGQTASTDKDKPSDSDEAPWPPLGLAGLVLAVPVPAEPTALVPPPGTGLDADAGALPAAAPALPGPALPASTQAGSATAPLAGTASAASSADAEISTQPLPEMVLGHQALDAADDADGLLMGDRAPPVPLQAPLPAALQDLKAALASTPVFNGEPTPAPTLGDDGFDQAIGARVSWLADQKIGHAHIRLNPEDLGPVDVRLQMNGDKVHASFSSPHVDVRQALESSLPRLRELLGEQGFQLAHADVGHQGAGDGSPSGQSAGGSAGAGGDGEPSRGDTTVSAAQLIRQRGLLDAYA